MAEMREDFYEQYVDAKTTIDETIQAVCKVVQERTMPPEQYADTVKALAMLTDARANYKREGR